MGSETGNISRPADPSGSGNPKGHTPSYRLRLFVAGQEPNSVRATAALTRLKEEHLKDRCELHVVDVFQDYQAAIDQHIVAVPALVVESPPPRRVIVGSLTDEAKLLTALGLVGKGVQP